MHRFTLVAAALFVAAPAFAGDDNPECLGDDCGAPATVGGGGCSCSCGCSVWVAYTDDGKTLAYTDDADGDGKSDGNRRIRSRVRTVSEIGRAHV